MITALHRHMLLPVLIMLLALSGASLSAFGEVSSHALAELAGESSNAPHDHAHSHGDADQPSDAGHAHHDASNHSHESLDLPTIRSVSSQSMPPRQLPCQAGDAPRSFTYRLERPPKTA